MKKKFILISLIIFSFIFSKISFATNDENIYEKIDLFGEVLEKINKDVGTKFGNKNNFNQKIDELNQETETLIGEIEKWQT